MDEQIEKITSLPAEPAAADAVAVAAAGAAVPTVAAVIVPAVELRRQSVGLESGRVELAQGQSGQH